MSDRYDVAVAYLTENPEDIRTAWENPCYSEGGCLFGCVSPHGRGWRPDGRGVGCLTQIRAGPNLRSDSGASNTNSDSKSVAWWPHLTMEIRNDTRIPRLVSDIGVENLHVFAEWQRRVDALREQELDA